ncbi:phosphoglycerate kinase [Phenylobacterium sp. SCN 70-31]|mgnify:CR=1 FL=1|uniref:phosphoglycerate kinase n=1 Tax=Phenylobacterium sp. SCN 70-31 TaxID=1660129 RepID=UPI00086E5D2F|nr:phosphoglycerate kinase [Phenylobacterium sp. SCN 70-31]ODT89136.1 MAG: phosphoglycerate kinase [Phenylobacterium sp. SCN 70-31]
MGFRTLDQADLSGKRALVRVDFNVPMQDGAVSDDTRLRAALPTIEKLRKGGAKTILLAHFDRPKGKRVPEMSLKPVVEPLARVLGVPVAFAEDCIGPKAREAVNAMQPGDVLLLENVRFHAGEEANDRAFADALAANGDLYVNDAFSAAHRAHASTEALARRLQAYAGEQMRLELEALDSALGNPQRPVLGIVGGSKVSTKLDLLRNLVTKLDKLAIGGGMANTFLYAQGHDVGASYCEKDLADTARDIIRLAGQNNCKLFLPLDVVVAEKMAPGAPARVRDAGSIDDDERILDAGPETVERLCRAMSNSRTLIWNGPLGVFEMQPFDKGTVTAAKHAAELARSGKLVAVAGGGDTVAALNLAGVTGDFTFVSTAGGAFLEWMEGKELPGVAALTR